MIEFVVTCQGLSVQHAMHAVVHTQANDRLRVTNGTPHPPTYVTNDGRLGIYDDGAAQLPPHLEAWLAQVYGQSAQSLLPLRRVNIVNTGRGIAIAPPRTTVALKIRSANGNHLDRRVWAGPTDYNVDGFVDVMDLIAFLDSWSAGAADFDCSGSTDGLDVAAFMAAWQRHLMPPCRADVNGDRVVDVLDLTAYLAWWSAGDMRADMDPVTPGIVDGPDLIVFLGLWMEGC